MNNIVDNLIVSLIGPLPMAVAMFFVCIILFSIKVPLKKAIFYIVLTSLITSIFKFFDVYYTNAPTFMVIKSVLSFVIVVTCTMLILRMKALFSLLAFSITFFAGAFGNVVAIFVFNLFKISISEIKSSLPLTLTVHALISCVFCIILLLLWINKSLFHLPKDIRGNELRNFALNLTLIASLCITNAYFWNSVQNTLISSTVFAVDMVLLIAFIIVSVLNLNTYVKLGRSNAELEAQVFYNNSMQTFIDEIRRIKHNFNNTIATISGYVKLKKWDMLEVFIDNISKECLTINSLEALLALKIRNAALLGLLGSKLDYSKDNKINFAISSQLVVEHLNANMYLVCEILGCLIDNALEAAEESESKYVQLKIEGFEEDITFKIENSFKAQPEISEIYKKGVSSKGDGRGMGLYFVKEKIKKEKYIYLNTYIKGNNFIQELVLEKGKSLAV